MVKKLTLIALAAFSLASCASIRPAEADSKPRQINTSREEPVTRGPNNVRFLEEIPTDATPATVRGTNTEKAGRRSASTTAEKVTPSLNLDRSSVLIEKSSAVQLKYAVLMNTEVENLKDVNLLLQVDEWYGTRYLMGGNTKAGIDCSAFTKAVYFAAFGVTLPRTAREQFRAATIVSATDLKAGDLVFFNTRGGVSHVGIYLGSNKFAHASTSQGVTVSDLFDPYYLKRFLGSGRFVRPDSASAPLASR